AVLRPVMRATQDDEPIRIMRPPLRPKVDVVDVQKNSVPTAKNRAPSPMSSHDYASHGRRYVLPSARAHVGAGSDPPHTLRVTTGHFHHLWAHLDLFAPALLPTAPAALAQGKHRLVARSPLVASPDEDLARQEEERCVVIERRAGIPANLRHRLAKGRHRVGRNLEPEDVSPQ